VAFGINAPTAAFKAKALGVTIAYAALNALSLRWAGE
jgi:hypothetical protein